MYSYFRMSRKSKKRQCPALGQEIEAAECGTNRHSKYDCPVSCTYSPYKPDNYEQLLDLETQLDHAILERASRHPFFGKRLEKLLFKPGPDEFVHAGKLLKLLHQEKDDNGKSLFEDWEEEGFPKLKNDTRVLLSHKRSMRMSLIEIQQVVDDQTVTFIDLLEKEPTLYKAVDRSMTARACRFQTMIAYYYRVPGFARFHASAQELPNFVDHYGLEAFIEVVNHLEGNTSQEWLLTNVDRICGALDASHTAQHRKRLFISDIRSLQLTYKLKVPAESAASLLRASALTENPLDDESRQDGYTHTFDYQEKSADSPDAATRVLGTAKIKNGLAHLYSVNSEGMPPLREAFEGVLGNKAEFQQELVEDVSKQLAETIPEGDISQVPPSFLEFDTGFSIDTSAQISTPVFKQGAIDKNLFLGNYYRNLLDQQIPAINNATPRQASEDFILRPKLVNWVKELIRNTDRSNLFTGESVDLDWMFDELGLNEVRVPAPPSRPRPEFAEEDFHEPEDYDDDEVYDEINELEMEEYIEKIHKFLGELNSPDGGLIRMKASGCNFMDVLHSELDEIMSQKTRNLLNFYVPAIWYALELEGRFIQVEPETLRSEFDYLMFDLQGIVSEEQPTTPQLLAELCMNMEMFMAVSQLAEVYQEEATEQDKLTDVEINDLMFHLIAVTNVLASKEIGF